jgi:hypothetical protein
MLSRVPVENSEKFRGCSKTIRSYSPSGTLVVSLATSPTTRFADDGTPLVISVIRSPNDLYLRISQRASNHEAGTSFETTSIPLAQIKRSVYPAKDQLQESWRYSSEVKAVDAQTLYHVFVVMLETVPNVSSDEIVEPLPTEWDATPVPIRATQANPRAFRGTKYQPPKARRLSQTDIRPHLCDARALKALVSPLWKFLATVRPRLAKVGNPKTISWRAFASPYNSIRSIVSKTSGIAPTFPSRLSRSLQSSSTVPNG